MCKTPLLILYQQIVVIIDLSGHMWTRFFKWPKNQSRALKIVPFMKMTIERSLCALPRVTSKPQKSIYQWDFNNFQFWQTSNRILFIDHEKVLFRDLPSIRWNYHNHALLMRKLASPAIYFLSIPCDPEINMNWREMTDTCEILSLIIKVKNVTAIWK